MIVKKEPKSKKHWKDHLLRSGVPLEYEVAGIFSNEKMSVAADFSFMRKDLAGPKEWSVDIHAHWFATSRDENTIYFELNVLAECKYRSPEKSILLIEDPNKHYSAATLGYTVSSIDVYAPYTFETKAFQKIDETLPIVYKGVEIHEGGAFEDDLRHGFQQLRYATPLMLKEMLDFNLGGHPEDICGGFFTKILVTNSPILLMNKSVDIEAIKNAQDLADISRPIDIAIYFSDYGPDFEDHFRSTFRDNSKKRLLYAKQTRSRLQMEGKDFGILNDPVSYVEGLSNANRFDVRAVGTQFFITTLVGLPKLLKLLKKASLQSYKSRKKVRKKKQAWGK